MTPSLEKIIKDESAAFRKFKHEKSNASRTEFNCLRSKTTHLLRKAARVYATTLHRQTRLHPSPIASTNFWDHMKAISGKVKTTVIPDLQGPDGTVSTALEKATLLNSFFVNQTILPGADTNVPDVSCINENDSTFTSLHCTPCEVYKILSTLDCHKAPGADGITPRLLRECASGISVSLSLLFNRSFTSGQFPSAWKDALVIPVF